ncbi:MAG: AAA family ATPase, partial [bacterium]|nr:AAA family ATPase [bacterium]
SQVATDANQTERSFVNHVRDQAVDFIKRYHDRLSANTKLDYFSKNIETGTSASDIFSSLMVLTRGASQPLYVIIDEYDNFSNTILTTSGESAYHALTHGEGMLRSFFNMVKGGTTGNSAPIERLFITGVSPVTMDDVTSGFNIGKNVSLASSLDRMLGFSEDDVKEMVNYYKGSGSILSSTPRLLEMITQWYGNYRFSGNSSAPLFNSDMILYFIDNCLQENQLPENLIDRNVRIDYGKLRHLIIIDRDQNKSPATNGNFSRLKEIIQEGNTISRIADGFPLKEIAHTDNFNSLLFYFGLLTIEGRERSRYRLKIPNETARRLYYDYIENAYKETGVFSLDMEKYRGLIEDMAYSGSWHPLLEFITNRMKESLGLRDLISGEKAVQTFLNVYLGLSDLFIVHSEKEMNKGYADLLLEPNSTKYPELNHSFLLELKYVKSGMTSEDPRLSQLIADAEEQLKDYALDEKFNKTIGKTRLIKLVLIFSGHKAVYLDELKQTGKVK